MYTSEETNSRLINKKIATPIVALIKGLFTALILTIVFNASVDLSLTLKSMSYTNVD